MNTELIKEQLNQTSIKIGEKLTNYEMVKKLTDYENCLNKALILTVKPEEHLYTRDFVKNIESYAKNYKLQKLAEYKRLMDNFSTLSYEIGSLRKGMKGEQKVQKALRLLQFEQNINVLFNVTLADDENETEYDAIILTKCGIFIVEVKNFRGNLNISERGIVTNSFNDKVSYNLAERMACKEYLLRKYVKSISNIPVYSILLSANDYAEINDHYKKIPVTTTDSLVYELRNLLSDNELLHSWNMKVIINEILACNQVKRYECKVSDDIIRENYLSFLQKLSTKIEKENHIKSIKRRLVNTILGRLDGYNLQKDLF